MKFGLEQQAAAVDSGHWILYRYNPELGHAPEGDGHNGHNGHGHNPFQLDSKAPTLPLEKYLYREGRYRMLQQSNPEAADRLLKLAKADVAERWKTYQSYVATGVGEKTNE